MPERNQWIAKVFEALLGILKEIGLKESSPSIFFVYAHDTGEESSHKPADAKVAQELIRWLAELGATIYSDRMATGNNPFIGSTASEQARVHDILSSQRCLLPLSQESTVDKVILCGSARLGHYGSSIYYREIYYSELKRAYISDLKQACSAEGKAIQQWVSSQVRHKDFHHVLTELAFLKVRVDSAPELHGIISVLLHGTPEESLPHFVVDSTTVRIEEMKWRTAGNWKSQQTYENQGLHQGFFKLLKRLWVNQERTIELLGEAVYKQCLQALQGSQPPRSLEALMEVMKGQVLDAQQRLIQEGSSTVLSLNIQTVIKDNRQQERREPVVEVDALREALYKEDDPRLMIQRVSGDILPMEYCYINLAVVEHQPLRKKPGPEMKLTASFHRLPSFEALPTNKLEKAIPLEDLFQPRRLKNSTIGVPHRILIHGRAGIGKTTLSKKSVYDYIAHRRWHDQFDWVLWILLRHLKRKPDSYQLERLFYDEYFCGYLRGKGGAFAQTLVRQIQQAPTKALLILDGWDEIAQVSKTGCSQALLNHPRVIITTRPYGVDTSRMKLDLELETLGFSEANVRAYLNHSELVSPKEASEIKRFIQQQPFVRDLVNIPIQLDALCYSWDIIKGEPTKSHTMTGLYEAMIHKLWCKDLLRLNKKDEHGQPLTAEALQAIHRPSRLAKWIQEEKDCLSALALNGLYSNKIEFVLNDLDDVIEDLDKQGLVLSSTLEKNLNGLSFLHVDEGDRRERMRSYQFLHLSFQEFFAAHWLVKSLLQAKPLGLLEDPAMEAHDFIRQHKYNPRYEMLWRFTAALLSEKTLQSFFKVLEEGPQDLIGIQHQYLMLHGLQESNGRLAPDRQQALENNLYAWLHFEVSQLENGAPSTLGSQGAFPEKLLFQLLEEKPASAEVDVAIMCTFSKRSVLSDRAWAHVISRLQDGTEYMRYLATCVLSQPSESPSKAMRGLIDRLQRGERKVKCRAAKTLGQQSELPLEVLKYLVGQLQDREWKVRCVVAWALGKQSTLSLKMLKCLVGQLQDENWMVRIEAVRALGKQLELPSETIQCLNDRLQDEDEQVREAAAGVLGEQVELSPEARKGLIDQLQDKDRCVEARDVGALGQQSKIPSKAMAGLLEGLKDESASVRQRSAKGLGEQSELPPEAITSLSEQLQDKDPYVRLAVVGTLGKQSELPLEAMTGLLELLKAESRQLRLAAARVLGKQSPLPLEIINGLLGRLKDEKWEIRESAASALGEQQSELPDKAMQGLIERLQDEFPPVRELATNALGYSSISQSYRLFATEDLSFLKALYRPWLIQQNFRQRVPFYLEGNRLSFYTASGGLESVCLKQEPAFRQAIWAAQDAVGLPLASRVKLLPLQSNPAVQENVTSSSEKELPQVTWKEQETLFRRFIQRLDELEFSNSEKKCVEQSKALDRYREDSTAKENKRIPQGMHFRVLDQAIEENFTQTNNPGNEGSAFLSIVRSCSSQELIKKVIKIISIEKKEEVQGLLRKYIDKDGYNILHCLADLIVRKYESGLSITSKDWEAFDYFNELVPELKESEDFIGRTPEDIITEQTYFTLKKGERECYIIPKLNN